MCAFGKFLIRQFSFMSNGNLLKVANHRMEFTNVKCTTLDKEFSDFEYCYLKAANRTYKYLSLKVRLYKVPIHQFSVRYKDIFFPEIFELM